MSRDRGKLFSALLKYWRQRRGLSQLDLALASEVSARHLSFLETGRAQPSREMVLRLGAALDVPLRDQNALLDAAGLLEAFPEPALVDGIPAPVRLAIDRMAERQEPFPLIVMNRVHDVLIANRGAIALATHFVAEPSHMTGPMNPFRLLFDPRLGRPFVVEWERVAKMMLGMLYREVLINPGDERLRTLLAEVQAFPDLPLGFRDPDLGTPSEPTFTLRLERDGLALGFLTTLTAFTAPQNITLEELRIESFFPLDEATTEACTRLAGERAH
jgi:transcriptional regulator with XRE-family HTH domain